MLRVLHVANVFFVERRHVKIAERRRCRHHHIAHPPVFFAAGIVGLNAVIVVEKGATDVFVDAVEQWIAALEFPDALYIGMHHDSLDIIDGHLERTGIA